MKRQAAAPAHLVRSASLNERSRANELNGRTWARYSISVWSDIRKSPEELRLKHPALFPQALVTRLIECFATRDDRTVLDPFAGVGSTVLGAQWLGKTGIGIELSQEFTKVARQRPLPAGAVPGGERRLIVGDARDLLRHTKPASVDLVITSPPYWDILLRQRTADRKDVRHYGPASADLDKVAGYDGFLMALRNYLKMLNLV